LTRRTGRTRRSTSCAREHFNFRSRSSAHRFHIFATSTGCAQGGQRWRPTQKALAENIAALLERLNAAEKSALLAPSEYLEVVIVKC